MTNKDAIVFIDGNNWYHNVQSISKASYIDFKKLAEFVCKKFNFSIQEIRYYNSVPDINDGQIIYYGHMKFLSNLEKQGIKVIRRKLQKTSTKEIKKEKEELISSLELCPTCKPLVRKNCGECIGPFKKKEKGIDVRIAVDMMRKSIVEKECDCCILISGDADFIPAMQTIKHSGKEVITASVVCGYSRELRSGKFRYFLLGKEDLKQNCFRNYKK